MLSGPLPVGTGAGGERVPLLTGGEGWGVRWHIPPRNGRRQNHLNNVVIADNRSLINRQIPMPVGLARPVQIRKHLDRSGTARSSSAVPSGTVRAMPPSGLTQSPPSRSSGIW